MVVGGVGSEGTRVERWRRPHCVCTGHPYTYAVPTTAMAARPDVARHLVAPHCSGEKAARHRKAFFTTGLAAPGKG